MGFLECQTPSMQHTVAIPITMVELSLRRRRPRCVAVRCAVRFLSFCGGRCAVPLL